MNTTLIFDCGDTLLGLSPPREEICLEALRALGRAFTREDVALAYRCVDFVTQQRASQLKDPRAKHEFTTYFNNLLSSALGISALSTAFDEAQRAAFARHRRWAPAPGALHTLATLKPNRRLFVLANWDGHLATLLEELGLATCFEGIYASEHLGAEKPAPEIFTRFAAAAGVALSEAIYVGNDYRADIEGSRAVAMRAVLMDWQGRYGAGVDCPRVSAWSDLPAALEALDA
jgi:FMN phosphatase YigB (HAD superfamily)